MEQVPAAPSVPSASSTTGTAPTAPWPFPKRFISVFTSPRALFEHLAVQPSWLVPFLVGMLLIVIYIMILWDPVMLPETLAKMEESGQASEQALDMITNVGRWTTLGAVLIGATVITFLYALAVFFVSGFLLGGRIKYKQALSIVTHSGLVAVLGTIVRIPLAFFSKTAQATIGPGVFFPPSQAEGFPQKFLANLLTNFDLFTLWQTALVALGVSVVANLPKGKANAGIWGLYLVFVLLGSLLGALFQQ